MKRNHRGRAILWLLVSFLIILVLVLLIIKQRQSSQPVIVPDMEQMDIAEPPEEPAEGTTPDVAAIVPPAPRPKIAIVIDDMGYDKKMFNKFVDLGIPLTFAVLPGMRFSNSIASEAKRLNYEVILHLPMEPHNPIKNPGNGTMLTSMTHDELMQQLTRDIEAVPHIAGVNNHMGSLMTENQEVMDLVLREIRRKGLFFLDSMTSPNSVAYETARSLGLRSARRDVFLDNKADREYIKGQFDKAIKIAKKNGEATAIGHPKRETLAALREKISDFEKNGIDLVLVSDVLNEF